MRNCDANLRWVVFALFLLLGWAIALRDCKGATYTFTESNTTGIAAATSCGGISTADKNFVLVQSGATTGTITTASIGPGASVLETFTSAASDPGVTTWQSGNWVAGINVSTASANIQWQATCVFQLNSGGTLVNTVGTLTGQTTSMGSTGLKTHTVSGSAETPSATDRIQVVVVLTSIAAHGNNTIQFTVGTSGNGETVATPITIPAPSSQIIIISNLFGGPKWLENLLQR